MCCGSLTEQGVGSMWVWCGQPGDCAGAVSPHEIKIPEQVGAQWSERESVSKFIRFWVLRTVRLAPDPDSGTGMLTQISVFFLWRQGLMPV